MRITSWITLSGSNGRARGWQRLESTKLPFDDEEAYWSYFPSHDADFRARVLGDGITLQCSPRDGLSDEPMRSTNPLPESIETLLPRPREGYAWKIQEGGLREYGNMSFRLWPTDPLTWNWMPTSE